MLRAVVLAARLDFTLDPPVEEAIDAHRHRMAQASPARLIEEYYKVLRSGAAERTFQDAGALSPAGADHARAAAHAADEGFLDALDALDTYRQRFESAPPTLSNPILLGTMVVPLGLMPTRERPAHEDAEAADAEDDALIATPVDHRPPATAPRATRAAVQDRPAADRAPRHRAAAPAPGRAAPAAGPGGLAARQARAAAPRAVRGRADLARRARPRSRESSSTGADSSRPVRCRRRRPPHAETTMRRAGWTPAPARWAPPPRPSPKRRLAVLPLELPHELHERVDPRLGEGVVDRRAHAADRAVALQPVEPGRGRLP